MDKCSKLIVLYLCVCYIPPTNSSRGDISGEFYDILTHNVYEYSDGTPMVICGDFNARIGNKDSVQHNQFPCIPKRHCVDLISRNSEPFNDFLNDCNLCVLNGRFRQECDNYTCISWKGQSMVDYVMVPCDKFCSAVNDFRVE